MTDHISVNSHSSIRIDYGKVLYFDPFHISGDAHDADIIFITHDHYDHFSPEDIVKIVKPETMFVMPESMKEMANASGIPDESILAVRPNKKYAIEDIMFETVPAYNIGKRYHPKENGWVGYVVILDNTRIYVCGDTDALPENKKIECDIMLIPVGGTYTMDSAEAAAFANAVKPKIAIPTHYGDIVGSPVDGLDFSRRLKGGVQSRMLIGN